MAVARNSRNRMFGSMVKLCALIVTLQENRKGWLFLIANKIRNSHIVQCFTWNCCVSYNLVHGRMLRWVCLIVGGAHDARKCSSFF